MQDFVRKTRFISLLNPASSVEAENGTYFQKLLGEKANFEVKVPREFQKAKLILEYQNPTETTLNLGAVQENGGDYQFKPIEFKPIDRLLWSKIEQNGTSLYQKQKKFENLDDFLKNIPSDQKIAQYFYDLKKENVIPDYKKTDQILKIDQTFRGSLIMYTYLKNEDFDFNFLKQDLNRYPDQDVVNISVSKEDNVIFQDTLGDDGLNDGLGPIQEKHIQIPNLAEGVYKISLQTSPKKDILIREIATKQHLLVFGDTVYFAGNENQYHVPDQNVKLYTNAQGLTIRVVHDTALQDFTCNNQTLNIQEINQIYPLKYQLKLAELNYLSFPIADFEIQTAGVFALNKENFFNPKPENILDFREDLNLDKVDYIITSYHPPKEINGWKRQEINLPLDQALFENKEYSFTIFTPDFVQGEIPAYGGSAGGGKIKKIDTFFEKESWKLKDIVSKFKNLIFQRSNS
jgi:hypothetical protein